MSKIGRFIEFIQDFRRENGFPRVANYEITARCNLNCSHCYWRKTCSSDEQLSDQQWKEVFLSHRTRGVSFAFLTGGEPSLRQSVIDMAFSIFPGLAIASNGVIKIPERIDRRLFISLDGPREVHNSIRGGDVFDQVLDNVHGDRRVILSPTLSTTNFRHIDELVDIARRSGVEGITFSLYTSHGNGDDPLLLRDGELDWTARKLVQSWRRNRDIVFLTPRIIQVLKEKNHFDKCFFKGRNIASFDAGMQRKKPCVLGEGVNCRTCGCIVPVVSYALRTASVRSWFMLNRMFPVKYFKH